jgi:hypothetical protein
MMTPEDCMRAAWQALLRGDTAERDRLCDLAGNLIRAAERIEQGGQICIGQPIALPDRSNEKIF